MIKRLADSLEKEMQQIEQELFSSNAFSDAQKKLQELDKILDTLPQKEEFEEANNLVRALEKGNLEAEGW